MSYMIFSTGVEQLDVSQEYKDKLLKIHDDLVDLKELDVKYSVATITRAYNAIDSLKTKMIDMITILDDITIQNPTTTDEDVYNIRVMEYFMEVICTFSDKFRLLGSPLATTDFKGFRIFNFNRLLFSKRTRRVYETDEDKYKPFKAIHDIKPIKQSERVYAPKHHDLLATFKRVTERNKSNELLD